MRYFLLIGYCLMFRASIAQNIGINANGAAPDESALLDIDASAIQGTKKGLLLPRMTEMEKNAIPLPAESLIIYQTDGDKGFWYYDGAVWRKFVGDSNEWLTYTTNGF